MIFAWWHALIIALPMLPTLWGIWHIWSHDFNGNPQKRALWLVLVVFLPCIGGLIYLCCGRKYAGSPLRRKA